MMLLLAQLMDLGTWAWMIQQQHLQPLLPQSLHLLLVLLPSAMPAPSKMLGMLAPLCYLTQQLHAGHSV